MRFVWLSVKKAVLKGRELVVQAYRVYGYCQDAEGHTFVYEDLGESIFETLRDLEALHVTIGESPISSYYEEDKMYDEKLSRPLGDQILFEQYTSIEKSS